MFLNFLEKTNKRQSLDSNIALGLVLLRAQYHVGFHLLISDLIDA